MKKLLHRLNNSNCLLLLLDSNYNWDSEDKHNGITIGQVDFYRCCEVIINQGVLKYIEYHKRLYYNRSGHYIGEWKGSASYVSGILYKEEPNW